MKLLEKMDNRMESMEGRVESMDNRMESMEGRMESMDNRMESMEGRMGNLDTKVDKIDANQVRMENELTEKVRALFDAREVQNDVNQWLISSLDRIEAKVDVLQLETAHLRRVK